MKIAFLKDKLAVYESLVRMCLGRGPSAASQEAAFAYIEQAKSRSLADLIAFRAHRLPASRKTHRALVEQVDTLRGELSWYSRSIQLLEGQSANLRGPRLEKLRRAARDCELRLVEALAKLQLEDREFANLEAAGSIDLETIRTALPEDAMLVEYYRVGDVFYVCLLSRRDLRIVELGARRRYAASSSCCASNCRNSASGRNTCAHSNSNCCKQPTSTCASSTGS